MTTRQFSGGKIRNGLHSLALFAGMILLCCALGWLIFGWFGIVILGAAASLLLLLGPSVSPSFILKMYNASRITESEAPDILKILKALAVRAGLSRTPALFYLPSQMAQAVSLGIRDQAAIAVTDRLLRDFSLREVTGVLAHEISHIRNDDGWVMSLADTVSRLVATLSWIGMFLLVLNLPLLLFGRVQIPWLFIVLLILSPTLSALMQLALARTREYDADLGAAKLTGDPRGLASALLKLERIQGGFFERIFFPGRRIPQPSLLRTHPPTDERVRRLMELAKNLKAEEEAAEQEWEKYEPPRPSPPVPPWWHANGLRH